MEKASNLELYQQFFKWKQCRYEDMGNIKSKELTLVPIFWANFTWFIDENGELVKGDALDQSDSRWNDYAMEEGDSSDILISKKIDGKLRAVLHEQIIKSYFREVDKFRSDEPSCILTHGGIASGKTSAVELFLGNVERNLEYFHIDFDLLKRQLPEFNYMKELTLKNAASFTHVESAKLAGKILKKAIKQKLNIIYEGSLVSLGMMKERIKEMRKLEYRITCISTFISTEKGLERAESRFLNGGRFVPIQIIKNTYEQCPKTLVELKPLVDQILLINNELDNKPSRPFFRIVKGSVKDFDTSLYQYYLSQVGQENKLD